MLSHVATKNAPLFTKPGAYARCARGCRSATPRELPCAHGPSRAASSSMLPYVREGPWSGQLLWGVLPSAKRCAHVMVPFFLRARGKGDHNMGAQNAQRAALRAAAGGRATFGKDDALPRFFESWITLCSRSRCGAREAMTVGCKPTTHVMVPLFLRARNKGTVTWAQNKSSVGCRLTTYRHRFARAAPAPRAKRNDVRFKAKESWTCIARQQR